MGKIIYFLLFTLLVPSALFAMEAKITKFRGGVTLSNQPVRVGMKVREGSTLHARGERSFVIVEFSNGSKMMVRDGKLKVKLYKNTSPIMELVRGKVFTSVVHEEDKSFFIRTKSSTMGVRGTEFYISEETKSYLCVCDGSVIVENQNGRKEVSRGEEVYATKKSSLDIQSATKKNWMLAVKEFKRMGITVSPRKKKVDPTPSPTAKP